MGTELRDVSSVARTHADRCVEARGEGATSVTNKAVMSDWCVYAPSNHIASALCTPALDEEVWCDRYLTIP